MRGCFVEFSFLFRSRAVGLVCLNDFKAGANGANETLDTCVRNSVDSSCDDGHQGLIRCVVFTQWRRSCGPASSTLHLFSVCVCVCVFFLFRNKIWRVSSLLFHQTSPAAPKAVRGDRVGPTRSLCNIDGRTVKTFFKPTSMDSYRVFYLVFFFLFARWSVLVWRRVGGGSGLLPTERESREALENEKICIKKKIPKDTERMRMTRNETRMKIQRATGIRRPEWWGGLETSRQRARLKTHTHTRVTRTAPKRLDKTLKISVKPIKIHRNLIKPSKTQ